MMQDYSIALYVPLQMYRGIGQDTFQPRIGFKTRYGMVLNPFAKGLIAHQTLIHSTAATLVLMLTTEELELLTLCNHVTYFSQRVLDISFFLCYNIFVGRNMGVTEQIYWQPPVKVMRHRWCCCSDAEPINQSGLRQ